MLATYVQIIYLSLSLSLFPFANSGEGTEVSKRGSHEALVFQALPAGDAGLPQSELMSAVGADIGKVGLGKAMSQGWVTVDKSGGKPVVKRKVQTISDTVQANLKKIAEGKNCIETFTSKNTKTNRVFCFVSRPIWVCV